MPKFIRDWLAASPADVVTVAAPVTTGEAGVGLPISSRVGSAPMGVESQSRSFRATPRSLWFMPESQFLAVRYLEQSGREAYRLTYSERDGRTITRYQFPDGYTTTSEDSAVDHLTRMLDAFDRQRGEEPA